MNRLWIACTTWFVAVALALPVTAAESASTQPTMDDAAASQPTHIPVNARYPLTASQHNTALATLRRTLATESRWVKVHAAEHLLKLSYPEGVETEFKREQQRFEQEPKYRIGIWRVLAQAAATPAEREGWTTKIRDILRDPQAPDHVHALETLAKLNVVIDDQSLAAMVQQMAQAGQPTTAYARWLLANAGEPAALRSLADLLKSDTATDRLVAAYALQWLQVADPAIRTQLATAASQEPHDSAARIYLVSAAWILDGDQPRSRSFSEELVTLAKSGTPDEQAVVAEALTERGSVADFALLTHLQNQADPDVQSVASAALLRIARRGTHRLASVDWVVIGMYFVLMLAIGWYYSLKTVTADDYLLGGRSMKPWAVGISLFATLCSTISYLSTPGEMIQHGPMYFLSILALPFVTLVIGWWLIPCFMKLPVTSAYEILETRLGLGVRMLGASFFLAMRLMWMAVILNVTTTVVLLPLLKLDPSYAPWLCAAMGLTTVIYSSMGGIRAVVMTDVVQTFILLAGAIAALALITWSLGGVHQWWPTTWARNWDPPELGLDLYARMSLSGVFISTFFWYLCTAGSDQMAIQRYLATRDVSAARRMFTISMVAGVTVTVLLALLGLALLAWFRLHPEMLGDGQTVARHGDQLFPRFIVSGLPDGVSGLIVAGLLAAAMSSLSSGLSSSCAVISVDFINRFRREPTKAGREVRRAQMISWAIGLAVVLLSMLVGLVRGNVLEVAFKVVNLLVAPLFGLFYMALFVRRATSFGTLMGAAAGVATVVAINYWPEITGRQGISFLWGMPIGLFVQIGVGMAGSLLPIGYSRPLEALYTPATPKVPEAALVPQS